MIAQCELLRMEGLDMSDRNETVCQEILQAVKQINFGEVILTIHDSQIVQIEKREKRRLNVKF